MQAVYRELSTQRRFGVELEVSNTVSRRVIGELLSAYDQTHKVVVTTGVKGQGWAETRCNDYWHVKYDSTCGPKGKGLDYGWEVASYIGQGHEDIQVISKVADRLGECLQVNPNCGLHVHVEAGDLNLEEMGVLLARWIKVEPLLVQICSPDRINNRYCRSLSERWRLRGWMGYSNPTEFWSVMAPTSFHVHDNSEKKYSLNTVGYAHGRISPFYDRQTVELRLPECRLECSHISNWHHLIMNLVEVCKQERHGPDNLQPAGSVAEVLFLLGLHQQDETFVFLDGELLATKMWLLQKFENSPLVSESHAEEAADLLAFISSL
jgi:hypothetical protein